MSVPSRASVTAGQTQPLAERFVPPEGYTRVTVPESSFGAFLRSLPLRIDRTHVLTHAGARTQSPSAAVVLLDVGRKNLQQCADSIIRLHAEWLWSRERSDDIRYHFTNGEVSHWRDWQRGERFALRDGKLQRSRGSVRRNDHVELRRYLEHVFIYAGTASLAFDSVPVTPADVQPGDFLVDPGAPGHAVLILDVATAPGRPPLALLGQGFMPAQEFHVLKRGAGAAGRDDWFELPRDEHDTLKTPSWRAFGGTQIRRFRQR